MALFRLGPAPENANFIRGEGIYLRPGEMRDYDQWSWLRDVSRDFLTPWEPTWPVDDLTRPSFRRRLRRHMDEINRDEAYPFFIFRQQDDVLLGGLTLGQLRRGVSQSATLGYWMGKPYAGKGYMAKAVRAAAGFAFATLRLHRLDAACLPTNEASIRLLEGVGFTREGYARAFLRINGQWQDHILFALLETDPLKGGGRLDRSA
jgi:ribosomal-protein-alanine N-acetyltransferase